jgi:hypothetical protein
MKELKVENHLKRGQYRYDFKKVPIADIDMVASKENPARLTTAVDLERVNKYGIEMLDGVDFPAIVLLNLPPENPYKWIIATGVHRTFAAIDAEQSMMESYCVYEADDYRRDLLFKQLNTLEGIGVTISEQIRLVIDIHVKRGIPLKQLAQEWDLKEASLKFALHDYRARQRGDRHGWDFKAQKTPQKVYLALNRIQSDVTYDAAAHVAFNYKMNPSEIEGMVSEIIRTKSEAEARTKIEECRDAALQQMQRNNARHGKVPQTKANNMLSDAKRFVKHLNEGIDKLYLASLPDLTRSIAIMDLVIERAKTIKTELEHIQRMNEPTKKVA